MIVFICITLFIVALYCSWLLCLALYWNKAETKTTPIKTIPVSIIIPFRNEENHLQACVQSIKAQQYDMSKCEIILVNDHSSDDSKTIANRIADVVSLHLPDALSGKKSAITFGVKHATHEIIITMDADVFVNETWLASMVSKQQQTNAPMVIGQVKLTGGANFISAIQILEHFAITIVGGGAAKMNNPILCNGANLLFTKAAFEKVNAYNGNEHIASGDDVFLLNKINKSYPKQIVYLKNLDAAAICKTEPSFNAALKQRVRWAAKNKHNNNSTNAFTGLLVLMANISWPILGLLSVFNAQLTKYFLISILIKCIIDFLLLFLASSFYKQKKLLWWFPLFFCFYPIELIVIFILSYTSKQKWKDRIIN